MPVIDIGANLEDVEGQFELLAAGAAPSEVISGVEGKSAAGERKLTFVCKAIDGANAGKKFPAQFSLQPQALWKLRQWMEVLGVPVNGSQLNTDDFVGRKFIGFLSVRPVITKTGKSEDRTQLDDFSPYQSA